MRRGTGRRRCKVTRRFWNGAGGGAERRILGCGPCGRGNRGCGYRSPSRSSDSSSSRSPGGHVPVARRRNFRRGGGWRGLSVRFRRETSALYGDRRRTLVLNRNAGIVGSIRRLGQLMIRARNVSTLS